MLTAIVINFGITALLLALIYRSWWLAQLGDEGDTLTDEHESETEESAEETFRSTAEDEDAVQASLEESARDEEVRDDLDASLPSESLPSAPREGDGR